MYSLTLNRFIPICILILNQSVTVTFGGTVSSQFTIGFFCASNDSPEHNEKILNLMQTFNETHAVTIFKDWTKDTYNGHFDILIINTYSPEAFVS